MNMKKFFAQTLGWLGGAVSAGGASGQFGKYSGIGLIIGPLLTSLGVHFASQTGPKPTVPVFNSNVALASGAYLSSQAQPNPKQ